MPKIWAIADLHLSLNTPNKKMDVFGARWLNHTERVEENWRRLVNEEDLVLIPGDISWGMNPEQALPDLEWIHQLPGIKVMIKGNHDYWWTSLKKLEKFLPASIHLIQNNAFCWQSIGIAGTRLWDDISLSFDGCIDRVANTAVKTLNHVSNDEETQKIYQRELQRLENSLKALPKHCTHRIVMTHYPPVGPHLEPSMAAAILEQYGVNQCVFGHIHSLKEGLQLFGTLNNVQYLFTACDYLNCTPLLVYSF